MPNRFIDRVLTDETLDVEEEFDNEIDRWHDTPEPNEKLHEWLGLSWEEYATVVRNPSKLLPLIIQTRKQGLKHE